MITLKIKVTKAILEQSKMCGIDHLFNNGYGTNCAIACAVIDIFPDAWVFSTSILPIKSSDGNHIRLPQNAIEYISKFDSLISMPEKRLELPELEFEIDIPDEIIEKINIDEIRPLLKNHPTLELV